MHELFVASLFGGALAIALFSILGWVGGAHAGGHAHVQAAHGGHVHVGHGAAGHGAHGHAAGGHAGGQAAHPHAAHGPSSGHSSDVGSQVTVRQVSLASSVGWALSWISPLTIAGAALWFGAAGLIAERSASSVAILVAIVAALVGAVIVRSIMGAFMRASTPPLQLTAEGAIGMVNAAIRSDGVGEVVYTLEGLHRSLPARSLDGMPIPRGTSVVIVRREGGFAWVTPLDPLSQLQSDAVLPLAGNGAEESGVAGESRPEKAESEE